MLQSANIRTSDSEAAYGRVAGAIRFLAENYAKQPSLEEAARVAGLSPFHFQREFSRLAGVSPKSFVAHLTLERAKTSLASGETVLAAAFDAGLSGPSRLHDLCLKIEAMTPGSYAKGGAGLELTYGFHPSLFGTALIVCTPTGLCGLGFGDQSERDAMLDDMRSRWPKADFVESSQTTEAYAERIFHRGGAGLPVQLFGTPWQIKVWQALLAIPEGKVTSYRAIAERVCTIRASRAAGAAIGRNPISLLIPCHRVLASNGALTGYHWGETRKRAMLALEAARAEARKTA
ncbi:MAG TPA: methylated-DNA--[protein]-cysteine S-methyltransferase [Burkholderiales bacterium]|jgi:AraC family transcriptional regulator of adaptative response/methylated-DNA-[protein]-cysteine methyltransferase|nr:methylated-DNA--[protein]-cysteine S-methyltransferase [Burkholderiales bacterium]